MADPSKLTELDFDDYAAYLGQKGRVNMKVMLDFIVEELTHPFKDPRESFEDITDKELFFKLTKENPDDLKIGGLMTAKISGLFKFNLNANTDSGLKVRINAADIFDKM